MPTNKKGYWSKNNNKNYKKYQGTAKAKKERASRNAANRKLKPKKGYEVDHKDSNPRNNSRSNLRVVKRTVNRRKGAAKANSK